MRVVQKEVPGHLSSLKRVTKRANKFSLHLLVAWIGGLVVKEGFLIDPLQNPGFKSPNHQPKPPIKDYLTNGIQVLNNPVIKSSPCPPACKLTNHA